MNCDRLSPRKVYNLHCFMLFGDAGHIARSALDALLKIQIDLGVLGSLSILSAATKDLVEETLINLELASEDLLIYRPLASA